MLNVSNDFALQADLGRIDYDLLTQAMIIIYNADGKTANCEE